MPQVGFRVSGRVQGVGYRWFCVRTAKRLGVRGFARNLPDGSVEVVADGPDALLAELEAQLRVGPQASQVTDIAKRPVERAEDFDDFEIRH